MNAVTERIGVSVSHLGDIFKSYTGMTPHQYFLNTKINKAKELLETESASISG